MITRSVTLRLPIPDRDKVNLGLPLFTLDVNQIALRPPAHRPTELSGLTCLEYHYFEVGSVELCVTPEVAREIGQGVSVNSLGRTAYHRMMKTEFFKARPASTSLDLTDDEADDLWNDVRDQLWPQVQTSAMTPQQHADVGQLFFHIVSSSTALNVAFVSNDGNFLRRAPDLRDRYGVRVLGSNDAWDWSRATFGLAEPQSSELDSMWQRQDEFLRRLRSC